MNPADAAKDLITLAGGPSIFGVAALLGFLASTLAKPERDPRKGWYLLGGGLLLTSWLLMFIIIAAPAVFASWTSNGALAPALVLLSATWIVTITLAIVLVAHTKAVATYLADSYPPAEGPWPVQCIRRLLS